MTPGQFALLVAVGLITLLVLVIVLTQRSNAEATAREYAHIKQMLDLGYEQRSVIKSYEVSEHGDGSKHVEIISQLAWVKAEVPQADEGGQS